MEIFYYSGLIISIFLFILLLSKKGKITADKILVFWLFIIGSHIFFYISRIDVQKIQYPILLGLEFPFPLLHGPLLYLYCLFITGKNKQGKFGWILHFIAPTISLLAAVPFIFSSPEYKNLIYKKSGQGYEFYMSGNLTTIYISGLVYTIMSISILRKHAREILHQFSYTDKINLNWLRYLVYGLSVIWLVVAYGNDKFIFISLVIFVFLLGFFGIRQNGIFSNSALILSPDRNSGNLNEVNIQLHAIEKNKLPDSSTGDTKIKYAKSGLNVEQSKSIHQKLLILMQTKRLFTEPELSLNDLATELVIHPNYLSQIINEQEGRNFYDYINLLRVEEFKRIAVLPENKKYTILTLSVEAGFNSKSSFNRYFKKVTGLSPSAYIEKYQY